MIIVMTRFPKIKFGHCDLNATITGVQRTSWSKNFRVDAANVSARRDDLRWEHIIDSLTAIMHKSVRIARIPWVGGCRFLDTGLWLFGLALHKNRDLLRVCGDTLRQLHALQPPDMDVIKIAIPVLSCIPWSTCYVITHVTNCTRNSGYTVDTRVIEVANRRFTGGACTGDFSP